jgi:hypothetical protein
MLLKLAKLAAEMGMGYDIYELSEAHGTGNGSSYLRRLCLQLRRLPVHTGTCPAPLRMRPSLFRLLSQAR